MVGTRTVEFLRAKQRAEQASRAKTDFLASISHELRTPLNAVIGYSEILLEEAEENGLSGSAADIQKIRTAGRHILALVNDILDLSKIEAGKMDIFLERVSLPDIIDDAARKRVVQGEWFAVSGDLGSSQTIQIIIRKR